MGTRKEEKINMGIMDWDDSALIAAYDSAVQSYVVNILTFFFFKLILTWIFLIFKG